MKKTPVAAGSGVNDYSRRLVQAVGPRGESHCLWHVAMAQKLDANTVTSTLKYLANRMNHCRLNRFFPASTSEIVDLAIFVPRLSSA